MVDLIVIFRKLSIYATNNTGAIYIEAVIKILVIFIYRTTIKSLGLYPYTNKKAIIVKIFIIDHMENMNGIRGYFD